MPSVCRAIAPQQRKSAGRVSDPATTAAVKQHHRDIGFNDPLTDDIKKQQSQGKKLVPTPGY
jgi:hypothetical protein